jgi:DNA polymerase-3 subunit alpha
VKNYTNLINFSHYSVSSGLSTVDEIIKKAVDNKQKYASLTDINTLSGIPEFYEKCVKNNLKPIIGATISIKDNNEYIGDVTLIAKNQQGFDNIKRLVSKLGEFKNNILRTLELEELLKNSKDILLLEGGKNSIVYNINDQEDYNKVFSKLNNSFGLSLIGTIQPNSNKEESIETAQRLMKAINNSAVKNQSSGKIRKNRIIFTNNNRFQNKEEYFLQMNKFHEYSYLKKSLEKSKELVPEDTFIYKNDYYLNEEELNNSLKMFADKLEGKGFLISEENIVPKIGEYTLFKDPEFPKLSEDQNLDSIIEERLKDFKEKIPEEKRSIYLDRLKEEAEVINKMGFGDYFVISNEISKSAQFSGQTTAIRGSGAGSLIVHLLGLSDIDPIRHDLMFGRFLNEGRGEYPDLDIETSDNNEMLSLLKDTYGEENSANLVSYDTISKSNMTFNFVLNSLKRYATQDLEFQQKLNVADNKISKSLAYFTKSKKKLSEILETNHFIQKIYKEDKLARKIIDLSIKMEGQIRNRKISIGTAILSNKSIQNTSSIVKTESGVKSYIEVDKHYIQKMGHLKMDILSSVILKKLNLAAKNSNNELADLANDLEDPKVYHFLSKGLLSHINQISSRFKLESDVTEKNPQGIGATMCKEIQPKNFQELSAIMALIRMGEEDENGDKPEQYQKYLDGKINPESIVYKHPSLKDVLSETYGALIFEEQIMKISQKIANFNDSEADDLRSVIKKENKEAIPAIKEKFVANAIKNNISAEVAVDIFKDIEEKMGTYQFNKAHACVYATIAYQQMYLKVHHPAEFYEAHYDKDNVEIYKHELLNLGTFIKRPDINSSNDKAETVHLNNQGKKQLLLDFSLKDIINNNVLDNILQERKEFGFYDDIFEYCERILPIYTDCNLMSEGIKANKTKTQIETFKNDTIKLIKVGAFDDLKLTENNDLLYNRSLLVENIDTIVNASINSHIELDINIKEPQNILSNDEIENFENDTMPISPLEHYNKIVIIKSKKKQSRKIS